METIILITGVTMYAAGLYVGRNWERFTRKE